MQAGTASAEKRCTYKSVWSSQRPRGQPHHLVVGLLALNYWYRQNLLQDKTGYLFL